MNSKIVNVKILDKIRTFRTDMDEKHVQGIADIVNDKIYKIAEQRHAEPSESMALMASLDIASELYQLRKDYKRLLSLSKDNDEEK